jgi:hypothetical protein
MTLEGSSRSPAGGEGEVWFSGVEPLAVTDAQREIVEKVRDSLLTLRPRFLRVEESRVVLDADRLELRASHAANLDVSVDVHIEESGCFWVGCRALHPSFWLGFNDVYDHDDLGGVGDGLEALNALIKGRFESEVYWDGQRVIKSVEYIVSPEGRREPYYTQVSDLLARFTADRCEVRRVSFVDSWALRSEPCRHGS